jgi:hypothetical protein
LLLVLCLTLPLAAQTRTRIFVGDLEYTGPQLTVDGILYVDAARFATAMGWVAKTSDDGTAVASSDDKLSVQSGLTVNGTPFTGATKIDKGTLYVSFSDLVTLLQGSQHTVAAYHTIKATIPGLPTAAALAAHPVRKMVEVETPTTGYRVVEFYATW